MGIEKVPEYVPAKTVSLLACVLGLPSSMPKQAHAIATGRIARNLI
jgi:hypothetical protein